MNSEINQFHCVTLKYIAKLHTDTHTHTHNEKKTILDDKLLHFMVCGENQPPMPTKKINSIFFIHLLREHIILLFIIEFTIPCKSHEKEKLAIVIFDLVAIRMETQR